MSDDCSYGVAVVDALLARFGLQDRWCFVDAANRYHGLPREQVEAVLASADLLVDMSADFFLGTPSTWLVEAAHAKLRVLVDGEPGFYQMRMEKSLAAGVELPTYDHYYTVGRNVGTQRSAAPTAGRTWRPTFDPVMVSLFPRQPVDPDAPFTTIMSWQVHAPIEFNGKMYGQKDVEFENFMDLPRRTTVDLEVAVAGTDVPTGRLTDHGWGIRDAHAVTRSFDSFRDYITGSRGEFSVCKNVFVATNSGAFSDRTAAYLASGRPVVMQETGFSAHLPCGEGLFAVHDAEEAAAALEEIQGAYERHSRRAREIAAEYLSTTKVLGKFLRELGLQA